MRAACREHSGGDRIYMNEYRRGFRTLADAEKLGICLLLLAFSRLQFPLPICGRTFIAVARP